MNPEPYPHLLFKIFQDPSPVAVKLYRIARYIEAKNQLNANCQFWDQQIDHLADKERSFYRIWVWLEFIAAENEIIPVPPEFEMIYGSEWHEQLILFSQGEQSDILDHLKVSQKAGENLLSWAQQHMLSSEF